MEESDIDLSLFPFIQSDFYNSFSTDPDHKRKPNFTESEKEFLVEQYGMFKEVLTARGGDAKTVRTKTEIWAFISEGLRQFNPTVVRTVKEVRKKWENLTVMARKEMAEYKLNPLLPAPSALHQKILEYTYDDFSQSAQQPSNTNDGDSGSMSNEAEQSLPVVKNEVGDNSALPGVSVDCDQSMTGQSSATTTPNNRDDFPTNSINNNMTSSVVSKQPNQSIPMTGSSGNINGNFRTSQSAAELLLPSTASSNRYEGLTPKFSANNAMNLRPRIAPNVRNGLTESPSPVPTTQMRNLNNNNNPTSSMPSSSNGSDWLATVTNARKRTFEQTKQSPLMNNNNSNINSNNTIITDNNTLNLLDENEERFIKNLRRRKMALEVEKMELDNTKLKLEIKLLQLRVEKERRSLE